MVMIGVEPTGGQKFFGTLESPIQEARFGTDPRGQSQTAVGPELPLRAKAMGSLDQSDQQSRSNRADAGNLATPSSRRVFPALLQKFPPDVLAQGPQHVVLPYAVLSV